MDDPQLKILLLRTARGQFRSAAVSHQPGGLDIPAVATEAGVSPERIQGMIHELVAVGYLKAQAGTANHLAAQGRCEITVAGLKYLDELEVSQIKMAEQRSPIGFQIPSAQTP